MRLHQAHRTPERTSTGTGGDAVADRPNDEEFFPRAWVRLTVFIQRKYPAFTREEVEDVVGEAIVRFCRYRRDHEVREPMALLHRIASGAASDAWLPDRPVGGKDAEQIIERMKARRCSDAPNGPEMAALLIRDWVTLHRPDDLPIVELRCQGLSHREIAERLELTAETVRKRYSRLIEEIRRHASEMGIDKCWDAWLDEDDLS
jgi:RNA polymerase sigma factor (sigma-70 family)